MEEVLGFLGLIVTTIGGMFVQYFKTRSTQKNDIQKILSAQKEDKKEIKEAIDNIDKRLSVAEEKQNIVEDMKGVKQELSDRMIKTSFSTIFANSESLTNEIRAILETTEQELTKLAISIKNSPYRKKDDTKWEEFLKLKACVIKDSLKHLSNDLFPNKKKLKEEEVDYDQFSYKVTSINTDIAVMIQRLVENGMSDEQYIDLFVSFLEKIQKQQLKAYFEWERL